LRYLIDNRDRVVPRDEIMQNVWEYSSDVSSRTIDTHIAWLRQKVEDNPQAPRHIQTIRKRGYRFNDQPVLRRVLNGADETPDA